jgi:hypothetical protein
VRASEGGEQRGSVGRGFKGVSDLLGGAARPP